MQEKCTKPPTISPNPATSPCIDILHKPAVKAGDRQFWRSKEVVILWLAATNLDKLDLAWPAAT